MKRNKKRINGRTCRQCQLKVARRTLLKESEEERRRRKEEEGGRKRSREKKNHLAQVNGLTLIRRHEQKLHISAHTVVDTIHTREGIRTLLVQPFFLHFEGTALLSSSLSLSFSCTHYTLQHGFGNWMGGLLWLWLLFWGQEMVWDVWGPFWHGDVAIKAFFEDFRGIQVGEWRWWGSLDQLTQLDVHVQRVEVQLKKKKAKYKEERKKERC